VSTDGHGFWYDEDGQTGYCEGCNWALAGSQEAARAEWRVHLLGLADRPTMTVTVPADPSQPVHWQALPDGDALEFAQRAVGGYIEAVAFEDLILYCNEEGKIRGLPANARATALWHHLAGGPTGDVLMGDVLVVGRDATPDTIGLRPDQIESIAALLT
jgi:hypothetical protein